MLHIPASLCLHNAEKSMWTRSHDRDSRHSSGCKWDLSLWLAKNAKECKRMQKNTKEYKIQEINAVHSMTRVWSAKWRSSSSSHALHKLAKIAFLYWCVNVIVKSNINVIILRATQPWRWSGGSPASHLLNPQSNPGGRIKLFTLRNLILTIFNF